MLDRELGWNRVNLNALSNVEINRVDQNKKPSQLLKLQGFCRLLCGPDGTRTRDLRRDRAAF